MPTGFHSDFDNNYFRDLCLESLCRPIFICDRYDPRFNSIRDSCKVSAYLRVKVSPYSRIKVSAYSRVKVSPHSHIKVRAYSRVKVSLYSCIKVSSYLRVKVSAYSRIIVNASICTQHHGKIQREKNW